MLKDEYREELKQLTPRQCKIVVDGLRKKLLHHEGTGHLSYKYEVCPVCNDMGSTEEDKKCEDCYIAKSCQAPFNDGFRNNVKEGVRYFTEMFHVLQQQLSEYPRVLIVGGTWDLKGGKPSKIIEKLGEEFNTQHVFNGGHVLYFPNQAIKEQLASSDLVLWFMKVPNEIDKAYPKKKPGSVLICSKIMGENTTRADAVSRIFKMHGNAVTEIRWTKNGDKWRCNFNLVDALGNSWTDTPSIMELTKAILMITEWTKSSIRTRSYRVDAQKDDLARFMECTKKVSDGVENELGDRYFGNISTRCQSMFPGARERTPYVLISPRNTDKRRLEAEDLVRIYNDKGQVAYFGENKPSVDAPIQLALFNLLPQINYFIHGHAHIKDAPTTEDYYPCGDRREVNTIAKLLGDLSKGAATSLAINLKNHGFLLMTSTLDEMETLVGELEFEDPQQ